MNQQIATEVIEPISVCVCVSLMYTDFVECVVIFVNAAFKANKNTYI